MPVSLAPYFTIYSSSGTDIGRYAVSMVYEDCCDEDDLVRIRFRQASLALIESKDLQVGKAIKIKFGYKGGKVSRVYTFEISVVEPIFSLPSEIQITASVVGYTIKNGVNSTDWSGKSLSYILTEIAKRNGLVADLRGLPTISYKEKKQANVDDIQFITSLLEELPNGPFQYWVKNGKLSIGVRPSGKEPSRSLLFGQNGQIERFLPKINNQVKGAANIKVSAEDINTATGKASSTTATGATDSFVKQGIGAIIGNAAKYTANGLPIINGASPQATSPNTITTIQAITDKVLFGDGFLVKQNPNSEVAKAAKNKANNLKAKKSESELTASLVLNEADPTILAGDVYTVYGVGSVYAGNYLIKKVTHSIAWGQAYQQDLEFSRSALTKVQTGTNTKVITKASDNTNSNKQSVGYVYGPDGKRITASSSIGMPAVYAPISKFLGQ